MPKQRIIGARCHCWLAQQCFPADRSMNHSSALSAGRGELWESEPTEAAADNAASVGYGLVA